MKKKFKNLLLSVVLLHCVALGIFAFCVHSGPPMGESMFNPWDLGIITSFFLGFVVFPMLYLIAFVRRRAAHMSATSEQQLVKQFPWNQISPEEYAARNSHLIGAFAFDEFKFKNLEFQKWIVRLGSTLRDAEKLEEYRKKYLSPKEYRKVKQAMAGAASGKAD